MSIVPGFRLDELLAELESLDGASPEGFTAREFAKHYGHTPRWAREKLQLLVSKKKVIHVGHKQVTRIDGVVGRVPVYRLALELRNDG